MSASHPRTHFDSLRTRNIFTPLFFVNKEPFQKGSILRYFGKCACRESDKQDVFSFIIKIPRFVKKKEKKDRKILFLSMFV